MLNLEQIGEKIASQRKTKGMTQNELAEALFVTHQAVSKWENGKSLPSIEVLVELTNLFGVSIEYLLENTEIKESDYAAMFMQYSREAVINRFYNSASPNEDIIKIFYLLSPNERHLVIERIIRGLLKVSPRIIWPYLNEKERRFLLGNILSGKLKFNIDDIRYQLTQDERVMVYTKETLILNLPK